MFFIFILSSLRQRSTSVAGRQMHLSLTWKGERRDGQTEKKICLFNSRRKKTEKSYFFVGDREKRIFLHQQRKLTHLCTCVNALQRHPLPKKRSNQWHQHGCCVLHTIERERKSSSPDLLFLLIINEIHFCFFFFEITGFFMC